MSVTFGLSGLPNDVDDRTQGAAFLNGYDRSVDVVGPEFTTLWTSDHFQFGDIPVLEGWTRLSFLAARYEHLRVGSLVLGQGYRNPALLAKMAATLQFLTQGRLMLGIGAGWNEEEYRSYGLRLPVKEGPCRPTRRSAHDPATDVARRPCDFPRQPLLDHRRVLPASTVNADPDHDR